MLHILRYIFADRPCSGRFGRVRDEMLDPSFYDFSTQSGTARYQETIRDLFKLLEDGYGMELCWVEKLSSLITSSHDHYVLACMAVPMLSHNDNIIPTSPCIRNLIERTRIIAPTSSRSDVLPPKYEDALPSSTGKDSDNPSPSSTKASKSAPQVLPCRNSIMEDDEQSLLPQLTIDIEVDQHIPSYDELSPCPPEYAANNGYLHSIPPLEGVGPFCRAIYDSIKSLFFGLLVVGNNLDAGHLI